MIPRPSQPNSIVIMLGEMMRSSMEIMNDATKWENR